MDESELMENQALDDDVDGENGGQENVVDSRSNTADVDPLGEQGGHPGGTGPRPEEPERAAPAFSAENARLLQSHEDNAAAKAARIRAETETTQRLQRQFDEQISGLGVPNPYTGKPFGSFREFKDYAAQFQREQLEAEAKRTGRTVDELQEERENQSFLARKRQEEKAQREAVRSAQARQEFLAGDLQAFLKDHPDVDVVNLEQNPKFQKFAGDRLYRVPLGQLYDDFVEIVGDAERAALHKAAGRSGRSTGGGQGGGMEMLTPTQREALSEWNRDNPEMKMTPKEFLG